MSGYFTRKMYDDCAYKQSAKQSTDPLELVIDITKYVNCNNMCQPTRPIPRNSILLVDVESSLKGLDKTASDCDCDKHPFCGPKGCLLTNDSRIAPHITPYVCDRGRPGDNAVVTTNIRAPDHPGYHVPNINICEKQNNGYYSDPNRRNVNDAYLLPNKPRSDIPPQIQMQAQTIRNQQPATIGQHLSAFFG